MSSDRGPFQSARARGQANLEAHHDPGDTGDGADCLRSVAPKYLLPDI